MHTHTHAYALKTCTFKHHKIIYDHKRGTYKIQLVIDDFKIYITHFEFLKYTLDDLRGEKSIRKSYNNCEIGKIISIISDIFG